MRLARAIFEGRPRWASVVDDQLVWLEGDFAAGFAEVGGHAPLASARLCAPVAPSKIVALASNYPSHAAEMGKPVPAAPRLFFKPPSALIGPGEPIVIPPETVRVDPEGELAVVIGRRMQRVSASAALAHVFGYVAANDVTARDFQKADGLFARAKGFDSFCPIGPWIESDLDPRDLAIETWVNGERRAAGRTSEMVFGIAQTLAYVSSIMTLEPGDVLLTGTPPGVAPIVHGDHVQVRIEGLGALDNPVVDRDDR